MSERLFESRHGDRFVFQTGIGRTVQVWLRAAVGEIAVLTTDEAMELSRRLMAVAESTDARHRDEVAADGEFSTIC